MEAEYTQPRSNGNSDEPCAAARGATVVVVDDDSGVRQLYATFLLRQGFSVIAVRTGREGLAKAKETDVQGIILDLALPDDTGYNLCRKFRRLETCKNAFITMISGTYLLSEERAFAAGADAILKKPFSTADLARTLCRGIADRQAGRLTKRELSRGSLSNW